MQKNAGLIILYASFLLLTSCGLVVRKPRPVLNPALILEEIFVRENVYGVEVDFENEPPYEIPQELLYPRRDKLIEGGLSGNEVTPHTIAMFKTRTSAKRVFDYYMDLEEEGWKWAYSNTPRNWDAEAGKDYASCELGVNNQFIGMVAAIIIVRMQMYGRTFIVIIFGKPNY